MLFQGPYYHQNGVPDTIQNTVILRAHQCNYITPLVIVTVISITDEKVSVNSSYKCPEDENTYVATLT